MGKRTWPQNAFSLYQIRTERQMWHTTSFFSFVSFSFLLSLDEALFSLLIYVCSVREWKAYISMFRLVFGLVQHTTLTKWSSAHAHGHRSRQSRADNERQRAHTSSLFPSFTRREFQSILIFIYFLLSVSFFFLESAHSHSGARVRTHANGSPFFLSVKVGPTCKRVEFFRGHRRNAIISGNLKSLAAVAHTDAIVYARRPKCHSPSSHFASAGWLDRKLFCHERQQEGDMIKRVENR